VRVICYENLWNPDNGLNFIFNEFDINVNLTKNYKPLNRGRSLFLNKIFAFSNFTENKLLNKFAYKYLHNKPSSNDRKFIRKEISDQFSKIILNNKDLEKLLNFNLPKKYFE